MGSNVLSHFQPPVAAWFSSAFDAPDAPAASGLAGDRQTRVDADPRPDRHGQDPHRVSRLSRPADVRAGPRSRRAVSRALPVAAQGAGGGRRAQPAGAAGRHRARGHGAGRALPRAGDVDPHRRHAGRRSDQVPARSRRHPHHHARIAVPAAHLQRARAAAVDRHRDRRRDPRPGVDQARRPHGHLARAARADRRARRCSASACRPRSATSTRSPASSAARRPPGRGAARPGPAPRRPRRPLHAEFAARDGGHAAAGHRRGRTRAQDAGHHRGRADRRHGQGGPAGRAAERPGGAGPAGADDLDLHPPAAARAGPHAPAPRCSS